MTRRRLLVLLTGSVFLVAAIIHHYLPKILVWSETVRWQAAGPGMQIALVKGRSPFGETRIVAVRSDPSRCDIRVVNTHRSPGESGAHAEDVCPHPGVAINASYFAEDGTPLGLLVIDGKQLQRHFPVHEWGTFQIRHGRAEIIKSSDILASGVTQALECKPRLIIAGKIPSFKQQSPAARSAVGVDRQGRVLLVATKEGVLTLEAWAECVQRFGCVDAVNLDGGPSTQMAVHGTMDITVEGPSRVPVFITASPAARR